jgi:pyrroline-5-carboxylate reductase
MTASPEHLATAQAFWEALGTQVHTADEGLLDAATAVVGSSPAYTYLFIEAQVEAAVQMVVPPPAAFASPPPHRRGQGFPRSVATTLVAGSVEGAVRHLVASGRHVAELRDEVVSPAGATAAALAASERGAATPCARG